VYHVLAGKLGETTYRGASAKCRQPNRAITVLAMSQASVLESDRKERERGSAAGGGKREGGRERAGEKERFHTKA
jgi:hypothetical protein